MIRDAQLVLADFLEILRSAVDQGHVFAAARQMPSGIAVDRDLLAHRAAPFRLPGNRSPRLPLRTITAPKFPHLRLAGPEAPPQWCNAQRVIAATAAPALSRRDELTKIRAVAG